MAETTKIEWTDRTASPWHGCAKVASGCANCYAEAMSVRNPGTLGIWGENGTRVKSKSFVANLRKWNREGKAAGVPIKVFPSICDPFEDRPELVEWRQEMFAVADECPWIILLLLTKRPENVRRMWIHPSETSYESLTRKRYNVWLGCSIATQADADKNIPELLKCRDLSPVLFVSAEPLIGKVDLTSLWVPYGEAGDHDQGFHRRDCLSGFQGHKAGGWTNPKGRIDWLIVGGESGPRRRPMAQAWAQSLVDQCRVAGVACFMKQMEIDGKVSGDVESFPQSLQIREFPITN